MNIDKAVLSEPGIPMDPTLPDMEVEVVPDDQEDEMIQSLMEASQGGEDPQEHTVNLANHVDEDDLQEIGNKLIEYYDRDKASRKDWEQAYIEGLDLLGTKYEDRTKPWPGSCGAFHPVLTEAVVRFQAQAITELFPASGPARARILGKETPEKTALASRVEDELNHQLVDEMPEYRPELEQLLFRLPLAGSCFKKVYYDQIVKRPSAKTVPVEDFIVPYGASDLRTASRYCHVVRIDKNDLRKLQVTGFYKDIDLEAADIERDDVHEKIDEMEGMEPTGDDDDRFVLLEYHIDYNLPGFEDENGIASPYIITVEKSSGKVLSIYRNFKEDDPDRRKRIWFVHYQYLPGMGFYGFGLIHLIGGLAKSSTSILRQLVDAGTLSNLPGGLKTRGLRIKGDNTPIAPGEFRDVDVGAGKISENIWPLPVKEPSAVLYQLLGNIVDEARRIGSIADMDLGEMNPNAPVGTTLALLERSLKVMSAVHARLHAAMKDELRLIAKIILEYLPAEYEYEAEGLRAEDFSQIDIIPVSDPNAATMAQRVMQYQAVMQLAAQKPEIYDHPTLHKSFLEAMKIQNADALIKADDEGPRADPVTENLALVMGRPAKVFPDQDHKSHVAVHKAAMKDPKLLKMLSESPMAQMVQQAMEAHIAEHLGMQYRKDIAEAMGQPLPDPEMPMSPEEEFAISGMMAQAAEIVLERHKVEASQEAMESAYEDPAFILQKEEIAVKKFDAETKRMEVVRKAEIDASKTLLERQALVMNANTPQVPNGRVGPTGTPPSAGSNRPTGN